MYVMHAVRYVKRVQTLVSPTRLSVSTVGSPIYDHTGSKWLSSPPSLRRHFLESYGTIVEFIT